MRLKQPALRERMAHRSAAPLEFSLVYKDVRISHGDKVTEIGVVGLPQKEPNLAGLIPPLRIRGLSRGRRKSTFSGGTEPRR